MLVILLALVEYISVCSAYANMCVVLTGVTKLICDYIQSVTLCLGFLVDTLFNVMWIVRPRVYNNSIGGEYLTLVITRTNTLR